MRKQIRIKDDVILVTSCWDCPIEKDQIQYADGSWGTECSLCHNEIQSFEKIHVDCLLEDAEE